MVESAQSVGARVAVDPRVLGVCGYPLIAGRATACAHDRRRMTRRSARAVDHSGSSACVIGRPPHHLQHPDHPTLTPTRTHPSFPEAITDADD